MSSRAFSISSPSLSERAVAVVTFGKALGTQGAAVLGSKSLIEYLVQVSRTYIFDTAPPPLIAAATLAAVNLIREHSEYVQRLNRNIKTFKNACESAGVPSSGSSTPIQPVVLGEDITALRAAEYLREQGFYLRAVRPPTVPKNTARLRICISAAHQDQDIERLVNHVAKFLRDERS